MSEDCCLLFYFRQTFHRELFMKYSFSAMKMSKIIFIAVMSFAGSLCALPIDFERDLSQEENINKLKHFQGTRSHSCPSEEAPKKGSCEKPFVIKSVPVVLTQPGKYCVKNDLTYTGSARAITIASDNVTLNFANHSLFLTQPSAVGVYAADVSEITIENDKIIIGTPSPNPLSAAISFFNVSKATIDNIYTQNTFFGVSIDSSNDILVINSHHKNHTGAPQAAAINIVNSRSVTLDNITTEGNSDINRYPTYGVRTLGSTELVSILNSKLLVSDSSIHADQVNGLLVDNVLATASPFTIFNSVQLGGVIPTTTSANDVIIRNSTFINRFATPTFDGILVVSGSGLLIENVVVDTNTSFGSGYFPGAIHIGCISTNSGCNPAVRYDNVIIRDTIVNNVNDIGILLEGGSNIVIENSLVSDSRVANIRFDQVINSVVKNSVINGSAGTGILINAGSNENQIFENTISDNNIGLLVQVGAFRNHVQGNNVFGNTTFGINILDATTETYFNTSCNNGVGQNCNGVTPAQAPGASPAVAGSNICCP